MSWQTGHHDGMAVGLAVENIDTDQLIPARFMSAPRSQGYGQFLLHDLRGPGFVLESDAAQGASILIAGRNFGCGSSREAAVYALVDAGFRAVVAPSFGDIFAANAVNNGLLPARMDTAALLALPPANASIDLTSRTLTIAGQTLGFDLDPVWHAKLINGWDDIDLTASYAAEISAHATKRREQAPWLWDTTRRGDAPTTGRRP
jgi:3-isopropylmalate/(R)-2-methylmalate dehydratase small subunit